MTSTSDLDAPRVTYRNPWLLVLAMNFGHSAALSSSIGLINLLMPQMMTELSADVRSIQWVQTTFLITMVILLPAVGWFGSAFGQRRLYLNALGLFALGTLLCTLAWNLPTLIVCRIIQAVGAGLFFPLGTPFIFDAFPPRRRGFVLGISIFLMSMNSLGGSVLAAHLADLFGWRWGFYYLTALACIGILFSAAVLKEREMPDSGQFDFTGCFTLALSLISLLLLINQQGRSVLLSPVNVGLGLVFVVCAIAFFYAETKTAEPFVDLHLYRHAAYAAGSFIGFLIPATFIGISFLLPIYLQGVLGYSIFQTALIRLPGGLSGTVLTPLSGWLSDRFDTRLIIGVGLAGLALATASLSSITPETSPFTLAGQIAVLSASTAFVFTPMSNVMFSSLPHESIRLGSGLYALKRQLGRSLGGAVISVVFAERLTTHGTRLFDNFPIPRLAAQAAHEQTVGALRDLGMASPRGAALQMIQNLIWEEATISAFSDCFLLVALVLILAFPPVLFLRTPPERIHK